VALVSITRLRLRSFIYELPFIWHAVRSRMQAAQADGHLAMDLRRTQGGVYWTMTMWRDLAAMRAFMASGAHRTAMPKLMGWCDEAAVAHWETNETALPNWSDGTARLAREGRLSKVASPSPAHAAGQTLGSSPQ
jgi:hypothetical protein